MIQLPKEPIIVSQEGNKAVFEIGPLYPGYGMTVGNALRRVLISSLEGAAVTSVKIKGVDHEFSAVNGVMEDVIDLILNLKKVRFKLFRDESVTVMLYAKGAKAVTAGDIEANADVEIINKDQHIATITDPKMELEMELTIEKGIGYVPVEQRQKEKLSVGKIAVDGIFTPIRNVNFVVENIRVGQRTDFNKVILEIETDGSIAPSETLKKASQILIDHFSIINSFGAPELSTESSDSIADEEIKEEKPKKRAKKSKVVEDTEEEIKPEITEEVTVE